MPLMLHNQPRLETPAASHIPLHGGAIAAAGCAKFGCKLYSAIPPPSWEVGLLCASSSGGSFHNKPALPPPGHPSEPGTSSTSPHLQILQCVWCASESKSALFAQPWRESPHSLASLVTMRTGPTVSQRGKCGVTAACLLTPAASQAGSSARSVDCKCDH